MSRQRLQCGLPLCCLSTLAHKFGDVFHSGCLAEGLLMRVDLGEQGLQVLAGELPLEWASGGAVVVLEAQQAIFDFTEGLEVIGGEHLALNDREVHLDLVEPTGVHGRMHRG